MSTRSGKRIHGSIHENADDVITEIESERKPRSKRHPENIYEVATDKKRRHYVRYPSEEDITAASNVEKILRSTRKSQKNTLKDQNAATDSETSNDDKKTRRTRRTRKTDAVDNTENIEPSNKLKAIDTNNDKNTLMGDENTNEPVVQKIKKKSNKKKNMPNSGSIMVEGIPQVGGKNKSSNISLDSFYSAAGSPAKNFGENVVINQKMHDATTKPKKTVKNNENVESFQDMPSKATRSKTHNIKNIDSEIAEVNKANSKDTKRKRSLTNENIFSNTITTKNYNNINSSLKVSINELIETTDNNNITQDKEDSFKFINSPNLKSSNKKRRAKVYFTEEIIENKSTFMYTETVNNIESPVQAQKLDSNYESPNKSSSYDKVSVTNLDATYDKDISNEFEHSKDISSNLTDIKNSTKKKRNSIYDKRSSNTSNLNDTFEKENRNSKHEFDPLQEVLTIPYNNSIKDSYKKKKTSIRKSISDNTLSLNATYEKDNSDVTEHVVHNNSQGNETRKSRRFSKLSLDQNVNLNTTYDKNSLTESQPSSCNNSTYDKSLKFNTTFEMVKDAKCDATFDKLQNSDTRHSSSLISSDTTDNITSEISKDISRISVTSDESMAENIVNTTPVLIESSMDESQILSNEANKNPKHDVGINNALPLSNHLKEPIDITDVTCEEIKTNVSLTPLKREGTYTEIMVATPPRHEETFTETKGSATTPKGKGNFSGNEVSTTPKREGTYTELATSRTPLKREGTYTELNPMTTQSKNDLTSVNTGSITTLKHNGIIDKHATPLKREGTFTKDDSVILESPKLKLIKSPSRRKSLPSPGHTPFPISKSASKEVIIDRSMLNVTRSIEKSNKRLSNVDFQPRATRVMFCSPIDTPAVGSQMKGKVIKSNLKGSDKSFVFDDSGERPARKRSHTQSEAEAVGGKRARLAAGRRPERARTASASAKLQDHGTPSKNISMSSKSKTPNEVTPSKCKADSKVTRTKLPNFSALHQKQFAKMESLDECQERKAKRARQLLTPTAPVHVIERVSPRETSPDSSPTEEAQPKKAETPKKSIVPADKPRGYTRFGFKLNLDVNPFSCPAKTEAQPKMTKENKIRPLKRYETLPSLAGATAARKQVAKQTILREKSFTEKTDNMRKENRTVIKGVRTNRRFELQMKLRNVK